MQTEVKVMNVELPAGSANAGVVAPVAAVPVEHRGAMNALGFHEEVAGAGEAGVERGLDIVAVSDRFSLG